MPPEQPTTSRRGVLKKTGATALGITGVAALGAETAAAAKAHTAKVVAKSGTNNSGYSFEVSDPDPTPENFESGDSITRHSTYSEVEGTVDATFDPVYDKVHYNGSLSNIDTQGGIAIYVDGNKVYDS